MASPAARPPLRRPAAGLLALALAAAALVLACGPRYARTAVHDTRDLIVALRAELREGEPVDRGFDHPVTLSDVRVANILARIDVREGEERRAAIPDELLFAVSARVADALARAEPSQEVVVRAVRSERRLGIFTDEHLTSFVCWVKEGRLVVDLAHVGEPLPRGPEREVPEPWAGRVVQDFAVVPGRGLVRAGEQAVAAEWRSETFRDFSTVRRGPTGAVKRREVLMESDPGASETPEEGRGPAGAGGSGSRELPDDLSPEALRALAELEEARREGEVTESEYRVRRREILDR